MEIKDIRGIQSIDTDWPSHLLVFNTTINRFAIINTSVLIPFGYYKENVYKGITESGYMIKMKARTSYEIKQEVYPLNTYIYFKPENLNAKDVSYLEEKRTLIYSKIHKKKSFRELMNVKT